MRQNSPLHVFVRRLALAGVFSFLGINLAGAQAVAPASYTATSNRNVYTKPALPAIGGAGSRFADPTFGSSLLRVTDANTRPGTPGQSYTTPSAAHQTAWNVDSTYFYVHSVDGYFIPYAFNPSTMAISRIQGGGSGAGGLLVASQAEPQFSFVSPNVLYVTGQDPSYDWPIVRRFDVSTGSYSDLLNLGQVAPIGRSTYTGGLSSSVGSPERVMAFFGGSGQDQHYLVAVFAVGQPQSVILLDTTTSTVTVNGSRMGTTIPLNFRLHHAWLDKSGQYVILESTSPDRGSPNYAAPLYVWDTSSNRVTALPQSTALSGGHYSTGFGVMVNQDCCTSTTWDAAQWQVRGLATPTANRDVIGSVLTPQEVYLGEHTSWNNAQAGALVPFVSGLYRSSGNTAPWRAWDDEIVAVQSSGGAGTVWRFAHHRSVVASFWDMPRPNISQDGRWALFTSNWEQTLGGGRQDVFLVALNGTSSAPAPSPTPQPTPSPAPAPSPTPSPAPSPSPTGATSFEAARWMSLINVTASGNSLQKSSGCDGCPDGTAVSEQQATAVDFTPSETGSLRFLGLGSGSIGATASDLSYALRLQGGTLEVRELGAYKTETSFGAGDRLRISVEGGSVKYSKNGAVFYTSGGGGSSFHAHAVFFNAGAALGDIQVGTGSTTSSTAPAPNAPTPSDAISEGEAEAITQNFAVRTIGRTLSGDELRALAAEFGYGGGSISRSALTAFLSRKAAGGLVARD